MYRYKHGAWCELALHVRTHLCRSEATKNQKCLQKVKLVSETPAALFVKRDFSFQTAFVSHSTVFSVFLMDVLKVSLPSDQGCNSMRVGDTAQRL